MKLGRNDSCACGSGKKYKNCCLGKTELSQPDSHIPLAGDIKHLEMLFNNGRASEMERSAHALLESYPNAGVVWKLFGLSLQMQGKKALPALQKAAELLPNDAEAHLNLAAALRAVGQLDNAAASGRYAIKINPNLAEAHNNLGVVLQDLGQPDDAVTCYRLALKINSNFVEAHNNLGGALKELGQFNEAAASYRRAIRIKPDFANAHSNLGVVLRELGQFADAEASYRRALEVDPQCHAAMAGIGSLRMENGAMSEAENMFRKVLQVLPDNLDARFMIAQVKRVKPDDENLLALVAADAAVRNGATLQYKKAVFLNFTLGKCFDDIGDYDRAFPYFMEGCKLKRTSIEYSSEIMTKYVNDIIRVFNRTTMERLRGGGDSSAVPIFVLGMPRSGTTLAEQILASHPEVYGAGELPDLLEVVQRNVAGTVESFPNNVLELDKVNLTSLANKYIAGLQQRAPDARHITDKMPANFFAIGLIHIMLPHAKIILVNRSPMDTCFSNFTQLFDKKHEYSYDLTELGQYYVDYARLMQHWRDTLPTGAFLEVQYEDIIANQEIQARRLIDFCGLEWSDACLEFYKNTRSVRTASVIQVRQPIYTSAVGRWKNYEKFLGPLLDALGNLESKKLMGVKIG